MFLHRTNWQNLIKLRKYFMKTQVNHIQFHYCIFCFAFLKMISKIVDSLFTLLQIIAHFCHYPDGRLRYSKIFRLVFATFTWWWLWVAFQVAKLIKIHYGRNFKVLFKNFEAFLSNFCLFKQQKYFSIH